MAYLTLGAEPERFLSTVMSPPLLATLGVRPMLGRGFLAEEEQPGTQYTSVIISHRIWSDRLGSDANVLGRTLKMNGRVRTVVGVMPPGFRFPETADFWIPLAYQPSEDTRGAHYLEAAGRLRPGVTVAGARAEVAAIAATLAREYPATNDGMLATATPFREALVRNVGPSMIMLMSVVLFVLLIACDDARRAAAARAHLDVDPEHQPQQLRPSRVERGPARLGLPHVGRLAARARQHDAAPPPPHPSPGRVRPRIPDPHLVALRHVIHPARQELERRHPVHPGVGAVGAVRDQFYLRPLGVVGLSSRVTGRRSTLPRDTSLHSDLRVVVGRACRRDPYRASCAR